MAMRPKPFLIHVPSKVVGVFFVFCFCFCFFALIYPVLCLLNMVEVSRKYPHEMNAVGSCLHDRRCSPPLPAAELAANS